LPFTKLNGIELFYEDQGAGPALVFLHGAAGNHISWWQQLPAFRDSFHCIAIDHRGFGQSTDPQGESSARFVDDLALLLDQLGIERTSLVAQSMGGRSALGFAVRYPKRVRALVLADTMAGIVWPEINERILEARAGVGGPLDVIAVGQKFQEREPARAFLYRQIASLNPPDAANNARSTGTATPSNLITYADLAEMEVPTLVIFGSDDQLTPPFAIRELHQALPNSELHEFADCGHSVYFEDPNGFNKSVADFLARHQ
jgi:3-oxoadipate enol-lactonase